MSHTRVKTTYSVEAAYGSTETVELFCHHNHSTDYTTFYWENGEVVNMVFGEWESGNDLWDAMTRLWRPFKGEWGKELKDNVEYYNKMNFKTNIMDKQLSMDFEEESEEGVILPGIGVYREMPKYKSHKEVWALKIKEIVLDHTLARESNREADGSATITPEGKEYGPFRVDHEYCVKHEPQVGGYYVVYDGGYESFSPADAFEGGYTPI